MIAALLTAAIFAQSNDLLSRLQAMDAEEIKGVVVSTKSKDTLTHSQLYDSLAGARVVYVGETHNHPEHHRAQLLVLKAMYRRNPEIAIAMEMFPRPCQEAIDRYVKGETDVETFLKESRYKEVWGYDFEFYRPLLDFAREHHLGVIAANAPQEIATKVSRNGLDSLTKGERARVAAEVDLTDAKHRKRVLDELQAAHPIRDEAQLQRFYEGMCLWDETMAESVAKYLEAHPSDKLQVVVYAGRGHVEDRNGIPARVARRNDLSFLTVLPTEVEDPAKIEAKEVSQRRGDFVWFTGPAPAPAIPITALGIQVQLQGERFVVVSVSPNGVGRASGIRLGDQLLRLDGQIVMDPVQVDKALRKRSVYDSPALDVERAGKRLTLHIRFPI